MSPDEALEGLRPRLERARVLDEEESRKLVTYALAADPSLSQDRLWELLAWAIETRLGGAALELVLSGTAAPVYDAAARAFRFEEVR